MNNPNKRSPHLLYYSSISDYYLSFWTNGWVFLQVICSFLSPQRYLSGNPFKKIHTKRDSSSNMLRVFTWMTYLNNVEENGETSLAHYGASVKLEKEKL